MVDLAEKARVVAGGRRGDDRRDRDRRGNGRRDDYRKVDVPMIVLTKRSVTVRIIKKPRNTSSEKKTGFVIRNKGDK